MSERPIDPSLVAMVEEKRIAHKALWRGKRFLPPWRWLKSQGTAREYRYALLAAAYAEIAARSVDTEEQTDEH